MKEKRYDGFIYSCVLYLIAMIVASAAPFFARYIVSFFVKTPNLNELRADATNLFDIVYPVMGVVTIAAFLFFGYFACYLTAYKIAYKSRAAQSDKNIKTQLIIVGMLTFFWNLYTGFSAEFAGIFGIPFWYPSAVLASILKIVDKHNLLASVTNDDLRVNNFVVTGINPVIAVFILVFAIILSAVFVYCCYRGRKKGEADGLIAIAKYVEDLKNSDSTIR